LYRRVSHIDPIAKMKETGYEPPDHRHGIWYDRFVKKLSYFALGKKWGICKSRARVIACEHPEFTPEINRTLVNAEKLKNLPSAEELLQVYVTEKTSTWGLAARYGVDQKTILARLRKHPGFDLVKRGRPAMKHPKS
jgi:hypothetical protein